MSLINLVKENGIVMMIDNLKNEYEEVELYLDVIQLIKNLFLNITFHRNELLNPKSNQLVFLLSMRNKLNEKSLLISVLYQFIVDNNPQLLNLIPSHILVDLSEYIEDAKYTRECYKYDYFCRELKLDNMIHSFLQKKLLINYLQN